MIVPSSSEDEILRELLDDYKSVTNKAKKIADKEMVKMRKVGPFKESKLTSHYIRSKNGNKWHFTIVCSIRSTPTWSHRQHCIVELGNGLRDIYYLRGQRFGKPYFVKICSHALHRMRERFCPKEGHELEINPDVMVDKVAFHRSEQGVFQYLTPPHLATKIEKKKHGSKVGGLALTRAASFVGYRTDKGNYLFLTFLGAELMANSKKKYLFHYLQMLYMNLNPKEMASLDCRVDHIPLEKQFAALAHEFPEIKPYIEHATEGFYVLYL